MLIHPTDHADLTAALDALQADLAAAGPAQPFAAAVLEQQEFSAFYHS